MPLKSGLLCLLALLAPGAFAATAPPAVECDLATGATGSCELSGGPSPRSGGSGSVSLSWLGRHALAPSGWYWCGGLEADNYLFPGGAPGLDRLQDYAALLSIDYFRDGEEVGELAVHPGLYFEHQATSQAWDMPVDLTAGVPIAGPVNGVVGFSNGRFYHHALPIFGLIWTVNSRVRVELAYPEPALVLDLGQSSELRLGGEIVGGGFLSDPKPVRTVVEYDSYRVGAQWTRTWKSGIKLALVAGVEAERSFDFFRQGRRLHGSGAGYLELNVTYAR